MGEAIVVAALTGVLLIGARTAGVETGKGLAKLIHGIRHHVVKPIVSDTKAVIKHETK